MMLSLVLPRRMTLSPEEQEKQDLAEATMELGMLVSNFRQNGGLQSSLLGAQLGFTSTGREVEERPAKYLNKGPDGKGRGANGRPTSNSLEEISQRGRQEHLPLAWCCPQRPSRCLSSCCSVTRTN